MEKYTLQNKTKGFTLIELLITVACVTTVLFITIKFITDSLIFTKSSENATQARNEMALMQLSLKNIYSKTFSKQIWINSEIASSLGLPWSLGAGVVSQPRGAMLVEPGHFISSSGSSVDSTNQNDVVWFVLQNSGQPVLEIANSIDPDEPGYPMAPTGQTSLSINVNGDTSKFTPNSILGILTEAGYVFARYQDGASAQEIVLDFSGLGSFAVNGSTQTTPLLYFSPGTSIFQVQVNVLGVDSTTNRGMLWKVPNPSGGPWTLLNELPFAIKSLKITDDGGASPASEFIEINRSIYNLEILFNSGSASQKDLSLRNRL